MWLLKLDLCYLFDWREYCRDGFTKATSFIGLCDTQFLLIRLCIYWFYLHQYYQLILEDIDNNLSDHIVKKWIKLIEKKVTNWHATKNVKVSIIIKQNIEFVCLIFNKQIVANKKRKTNVLYNKNNQYMTFIDFYSN